ncbi:MAG: DsrE family protein [Thiovulaceae bacterium]|nr:DsrE family protein [Sulfurimonadaceae bacterium]
MKKILLLLAMLSFLYGDDGVKKVVFDLTTGDMHVFKQKVLSGISNQRSYYEGKLEELKVAVVIHGDAYKFFIKDLDNSPYKNDVALVKERAEISQRLLTLAKSSNVEFLMCQTGMEHKKIDKTIVDSYVKFVPNATIGLIDKQSEGYVYIPIMN